MNFQDLIFSYCENSPNTAEHHFRARPASRRWRGKITRFDTAQFEPVTALSPEGSYAIGSACL